MQSLLILGRQPELGLAELESLYGAEKLKPLGNQAVLVDVDPCLLAFKRLGGSLKFARHLTTLDTTNWSGIEDFLISSAPEHSKSMPKGKMTLGFSLYGFNLELRNLSKSALKIKRAIQATDRSVRLVPNKDQALNTAQVFHNKLTSERGWELLIIKAGSQTHIAQTVMVQDIEAYAKRDQARPSRDPKVGMLPPKLAQVIINLAVGKLNESQLESICEKDAQSTEIAKLSQTVLDPFCGTGVILQEAQLMGYDTIGSDISPRMTEYSLNNLRWLAAQYRLSINPSSILTADARDKIWPEFDYIASEVNLGKPLSKIPEGSEFNKMTSDLNNLIEKYLKNVANQTKPGLRLCLAIPAWQTSKDSFRSLPLIDHLADLGYNRVNLKLVASEHLIYYRPNQLVARELLTLIRK